ncbi:MULTISPECIES: nitrogen regulation protein NR(II) [Gammaproteobacteria]|uniref:nitrogen regulation protein NR(II) n=1 Tax=Gammaproteobacteria TaxID=1236 RepID=UPI000DCF8911|nr:MULTISPECIES: nitrogen regulation protein NR(II) [Gammaproteobacteria]RTE85878.1 nitrogen regulation protein NR(II) [Aliidiomarina sp. B3213]TCZ90121.1 nitrogen regulation protein NR(II) [Lysobacter sp. N42]
MATQSDFAELFEQLTTAVVVLDQRLHITYANGRAESIFAGSGRRLLGAPFESVFRFTSLSPGLLQQVLSEQQSLTDSDVAIVLHDGKKMTIELSASPVSFEGVEGLVLEMRQVDLIRRLNQEELQRHQQAAAQQLVRGLAHEIKNPLGGIRGAAQLLNAELQNAELEEYTQMIMSQSDRLRNLVDRLLGPNQLGKRESVNAHAVIGSALNVLKVNLPSGIELYEDYDPSLPELILCADQMEQVLLNLLNNAVEALGESGRLTVKTRVSHKETIYGKQYRQVALISVIDNGKGVSEELKDTLFYPLVTGREGGTGLGLSIAQTLVHQHEGKIELTSQPGETQFTIFLPYTDAMRAAQEAAEQGVSA